MCLSKVYLKKIDPESLVLEEVFRIAEDNGTILVRSIFGEEKKLEGYSIGEVNMVDNYVILMDAGDIKNA